MPSIESVVDDGELSECFYGFVESGFDSFCDSDFAASCEEFDGTHFSQVDSDGVVGRIDVFIAPISVADGEFFIVVIVIAVVFVVFERFVDIAVVLGVTFFTFCIAFPADEGDIFFVEDGEDGFDFVFICGDIAREQVNDFAEREGIIFIFFACGFLDLVDDALDFGIDWFCG